MFAKYLLPGETLPPVPPPYPVIAIPAFALAETAPVFDNFSRKFFPQFHVAAILVWSFALASRASRRKAVTPVEALLFGLLLSAALLVHPVALLLAAPGVVLFVATAARQAPRRARAAVGLAIGLLPSAGWYARNLAAYVAEKGRYLDVQGLHGHYGLPLADQTRRAVVRWAYTVCWNYPGKALVVAAAIAGIAAVADAVRPSAPPRAGRRFFLAATAYYLAAGLWIAVHDGLLHDTLIVIAVVAAWAAMELDQLARRLWGDGRWRRAALLACFGGLLVAGAWDKAAAPASECSWEDHRLTISNCYHTFRSVWPSPDPAAGIVSTIRDAAAGPSFALTVYEVRVERGRGAIAPAEPHGAEALRSSVAREAERFGLELRDDAPARFAAWYSVADTRAAATNEDQTYRALLAAVGEARGWRDLHAFVTDAGYPYGADRSTVMAELVARTDGGGRADERGSTPGTAARAGSPGQGTVKAAGVLTP